MPDSVPLDATLPADTIRAALLEWFAAARRPMPWRQTNDPYAIWVSEVMLQQTQVATVIPYYLRFLAEFPSIPALAEAPPERVLRLWEGLGYYRRARNLQAAACQIVQRHRGRFPRSLQDALALPGIGEYTAAAILSIAFGIRLPCVDGNVERVLSRLCLIDSDPGRAAGRRSIRAVAQSLVDCPTPGDANQALMELGATLCTPREPRCELCPLRSACRARALGRQEELPVRPTRAPARRVVTACAFVRRAGRILLAQRPEGGVWAGLWEMPQVEVGDAEHAQALREHLAAELGLSVEVEARLGEVRHGVMDQAISLQVFAARVRSGRLRRGSYARARWVTPQELQDLPMSAAHRRALRLAWPEEA